jgi:hypothetical protein
MKLMKLAASWSATKASKERRQAGKGKSVVPGDEGIANCNATSDKIRNSSEQPTGLSPKYESAPIDKEGNKLKDGDVVKSTTTNTNGSSKIKGDRACFLFEDNEDDDVNENNHGKKKGKITIESNLNNPQRTQMGNPTPLTPKADLDAPVICTPKQLFHPPQEIMIDHLAVPPSPMRDPTVNGTTSPKRLLDDYHPGTFLSYRESSQREAAPHHHLPGDPVGDIAMQRQLMDAHRLVRIILGKPNKSQQVLGASSILQAIRSYALMKAELIDLRKKQEIMDGDPPAILQALGSPAATTPSTTRTGFCSPRTSCVKTPIHNNESTCESKEFKSAHGDASLDAPIASGLDQAKKNIGQLQEELATANATIAELREKMKGEDGEKNDCQKNTIVETKSSTTNDQQYTELVVGEPKHDENSDTERQEDVSDCISTTTVVKENEEAKEHDHVVLEELKQDGTLDLLLDEIILIPQRLLTRDNVRQKLELYYDTINRHSSENQLLEMEERMRQLQLESDTRILELENKMKQQDQEHKKQIGTIMMEKDQIVDTKTEESKNTILMELSHNTTGLTTSHSTSSKKKPIVEDP